MPKYFFILLVSFFVSCTISTVDLVNEETIIRNLLQQERKAHFDRDVDKFVAEFAGCMISVNKGKVKILTP